MSRLGKTSTGILRNAATPRITVSSAPTMTACGLRNENPGTVDDLVRSGLKRTPALFRINHVGEQVMRAATWRGRQIERLDQWVGRARARRPELQMLEDAVGWDF